MGLRTSLSSAITLNTALTAEQQQDYQDPKDIRYLLGTARTIAIVGLSKKPERASNFVGSYLISEGYKVIPVNPRETEILGQKCYPDLKSIPEKVDVVDIFRRPAECDQIVADAIEIGAKAVWLQLGVLNIPAAHTAKEAGLMAIVDRCVKMEHGRYNGNLHWVGMNTEIISAKKAQRFF